MPETVGSSAQGVVGRIGGSIAFGSKLAEVEARYFAANPTAKARLDAIAGQNRNYVAHEYFNRDWAPMYFSEAHAWLADAKTSHHGLLGGFNTHATAAGSGQRYSLCRASRDGARLYAQPAVPARCAGPRHAADDTARTARTPVGDVGDALVVPPGDALEVEAGSAR